jgi:hypothetical protein
MCSIVVSFVEIRTKCDMHLMKRSHVGRIDVTRKKLFMSVVSYLLLVERDTITSIRNEIEMKIDHSFCLSVESISTIYCFFVEFLCVFSYIFNSLVFSLP